MKKLLQVYNTPRPYISWSQYFLWLSSPKRYIEHYIYGEDGYDSDSMRLGKKMAERMELDEETDYPDIEQVAMFMPKSPKREYEIEVNFEGIPLYGILDGFNPLSNKKIIREMKTGKKWTQSMADKSGQLTFYTILVFAKYGKLPDKIYLDWAPTERNINTGKLKLTGEVKTFETKRTMQDILLFYSKIKKVWEEIQETSKKEYDKIIK